MTVDRGDRGERTDRGWNGGIEVTATAPGAGQQRSDNYKWIALSNTTLGILMVTINTSILLISLPDIFRGIDLQPWLRATPRTSCGSSWVSCW
jgi:hypothetical protein